MTDTEFGNFDQHIPTAEEVAAARAAHEREVAARAAQAVAASTQHMDSQKSSATVVAAESGDRSPLFTSEARARGTELTSAFDQARDSVDIAQTGFESFQGKPMEAARTWLTNAQNLVTQIESEVLRTNGKILSNERATQALHDLKIAVEVERSHDILQGDDTPQPYPRVFKGDDTVLANVQHAMTVLSDLRAGHSHDSSPSNQQLEELFHEPVAEAALIHGELAQTFEQSRQLFVLHSPVQHQEAAGYLQNKVAQLETSLRDLNNATGATGTREEIAAHRQAAAEKLAVNKEAANGIIQELRGALDYLKDSVSPQAENYLADQQMALYRLSGRIAAQQDAIRHISAGL